MLLREPFLVVGFFFLIFMFVILYVRLDFSISRDEAAESKMKVSSCVEKAQSLLDSRTALYQAYKDAVDKYKVMNYAFLPVQCKLQYSFPAIEIYMVCRGQAL